MIVRNDKYLIVFDAVKDKKKKWTGDVKVSIQWSDKNTDFKSDQKEIVEFMEMLCSCLDLLETDSFFTEQVFLNLQKLEREERSTPTRRLSGVQKFPTKNLAKKTKTKNDQSAEIIEFAPPQQH